MVDDDHHRQPFIVGFALKAEKASKHVSQHLIDHAAEHGIQIKIICIDRPLEDQGPFNAILQKIRRREWEEELEAYAAAHPEVHIHDMPQSTYVLRNRGSMLPTSLHGDGTVVQPPRPCASASGALPIRFSVPPHATIQPGISFEAAQEKLREGGIVNFPLVAKSLWADGRPGSHALAVIHTEDGLRQLVEGTAAPSGLSLPLLVEQYVDHGSCLFKVYVLGEEAVMVTRPTLNLETEEKIENSTPHVEVMSRVSAYPQSRSWGKYDLAPPGHGVPAPPEWFWREISSRIREILKLTLFNFDLIVPLHPPPHQAGLLQQDAADSSAGVAVEEGLVHLIDINYFPGIEKLPNYEALLVRFFERLRDNE